MGEPVRWDENMEAGFPGVRTRDQMHTFRALRHVTHCTPLVLANLFAIHDILDVAGLVRKMVVIRLREGVDYRGSSKCSRGGTTKRKSYCSISESNRIVFNVGTTASP